MLKKKSNLFEYIAASISQSTSIVITSSLLCVFQIVSLRAAANVVSSLGSVFYRVADT